MNIHFRTIASTAAVALTALTGTAATADDAVRPGAGINGAGSSGDYINWISAFARLDKVNPKPGVYNWSGFDAAAAASGRTGKPYAIMVILGTAGNGMPKHMMAGLPGNQIVSPDGRGTFPRP